MNGASLVGFLMANWAIYTKWYLDPGGGVWALTLEGVRFWGVTCTGTGIFRFLAACSSPR